MHATTITRSVVVPFIAILGIAGLAGCAPIEDAVSNRVTTTADSLKTMPEDSPSWIPSDATAITQVRGTAGDAATVLLTSAQDLDPNECVATPRLSAPTMQVENAPDVYGEDEVYSCGDWAVIASPDGWLGWTPAAESATSPKPVVED
ncbi:hypothetical protein ACUWEX_08300 [Okibacterium fritillariae]|uniref:hypothetical protein n=1 Tax=Okibacterium fritillariae TaxID=123320 RepID=UPI0040556BE7